MHTFIIGCNITLNVCIRMETAKILQTVAHELEHEDLLDDQLVETILEISHDTGCCPEYLYYWLQKYRNATFEVNLIPQKADTQNDSADRNVQQAWAEGSY